MWWYNKPKPLPKAHGPFVPGMVDVMLGYKKDGIFMRLYYPTDAAQDDPNNEQKWHPWVSDNTYIEGFGNVVRHKYLIRLAFWWSNVNIIPALYGAKPRTIDKLKCVIMSHGLGGTRFAYSNICCELASHGFLVIAIEHRDQSACSTFYYKSEEDAQQDIRSIIPYVYMELGHDDNHRKARNEQVHYRAEECCKAIQFLQKLNQKIIPNNVLDKVPTFPDSDFKLDDLVGHLDIDSIGILGHSFGGATSLLTLHKQPELKFAVLLDPWMFPIGREELPNKIDHPLLFINTQTFCFEDNIKAMSEFLNQDNRKMYTLLHAAHENQSDSTLLIGYRVNHWFRKRLDPLQALKINNSLILDFLDSVISVPCDIKHCHEILEEEKHNVESGLSKPWL